MEMSPWVLRLVAAGMLLFTGITMTGAAEKTEAEKEATALMNEAFKAAGVEDFVKAADLLGQALKKDPKRGELYGSRALFHTKAAMYKNAVADYTSMIAYEKYQATLQAQAKLAPDAPKPAWKVYDRRGDVNFLAGNIDASIKDYDIYIKIQPDFEPRHWRRGISYYYAGRYADGVKQFELHKTVNPNDVENAAWHFICNARLKGFKKARAELIPIKQDSRGKWMMTILDMFAGKAKPFDVLLACRAGSPSKEKLDYRFCHAHLYIGLYYEAQGDEKKAFEHMGKSAVDFQFDSFYMGGVSQVHYNRMIKKRLAEKNKKSEK